MSKVPDKTTTTRKVGMEDIIIMHLASNRFRNNIPLHYAPPADEKSRYQVALLAQSCESNSFDDCETGRADELHFWLQVASSNEVASVKGADIMLPSIHWYALAAATNNTKAQSYLQSFGFNPMTLEKVNLRKRGGLLTFPDGGRIEWSITDPGKGLRRVGVNHVIFVTEDGPGAIGHRIAALLSDTMMRSKQLFWYFSL